MKPDASATLTDAECYDMAAKIMAEYPVGTLGMYLRLVQTGYAAGLARAQSAAPATDQPAADRQCAECDAPLAPNDGICKRCASDWQETATPAPVQDVDALIGRIRSGHEKLCAATQAEEQQRFCDCGYPERDELTAALAALRDENARLAKAQAMDDTLYEMTTDHLAPDWNPIRAELMAAAFNALPSLLARVRAAEADAARYRWLRNDAHLDHFAPEEFDNEELIPTAAIDAAIDAARAASDKGGQS